MHTSDDHSSDAKLERCIDELRESHPEIPTFDDIVSRKQPNLKPLVNRRNMAVVACCLLGVVAIWRGAADKSEPIAKKQIDSQSIESEFDFAGSLAAIDEHFGSDDLQVEFPDWSTPADLLLTMNERSFGADNHAEY